MFRYVLLVAALSAGVYADTDQIGGMPMPDGRIVGGYPADITQFPHQISMRYNGRHRCGGSIYNENIIVSAAHCVTGVDASLLTIVAGSSLLSEKYAELPVISYIMHPSYKTYNNDNDVAILVLKGRFNFDKYIQPIPLAVERPEEGTQVTVTGWGTLVEDGDIPDQLQQVQVLVVSNDVCKKAYSSLLLTNRMMCAAVDGGGKDACQGDSGGPLIVGNTLLGIVSWGVGCARANYPGVYASVPELREWIETTAQKNTIGFA